MRRLLMLVAVAALVAGAEKWMGWASLAAVAMGVVVALAVQAVLQLRRDAPALLATTAVARPARHDLVATVGRLFPLFAAWILANLLLGGDIGGALYGPAATSRYSPAFVLVLVVLIALLVAAAALRRRRLLLPRAARVLALPVALLLLLAVKIAVVYGVAKIPGFDAGNVFIAAYAKAVPGETAYDYNTEFFDFYFGILPNNLFLSWALSWALRLGALLGAKAVFSFVMVAMIVNCVVLTVVELLTFLVIRRVWGARAAWIGLAVLAPLTTLSPWLNTPYSDTIGMLFPILTVYLWLRLRAARTTRGRLLLGALIGLVAAAGLGVKPTTVFALVAIAVVEIVRSRRVLLRRRSVLVGTAAVAAAAVVAGGAAALAVTASIDATRFTTSSVWTNPNALPVTHFLKMGAQGDGGYSGEDVTTTYAVPADRRAAAALGVYFERVGAMGVEGYPLFLERKALLTFSDGSFAQGKEGETFPQYLRNDPYSEKIRQWFLIGGSNHWYLSSLWQALWILLLLAAALPVSRFADARRRRVIDAGRISMLLLLVFLLFFETRARYVYLYVPVLVVLATGSVAAVPAAFAALRAGTAYRLDRIRLPRIGVRRSPRARRAPAAPEAPQAAVTLAAAPSRAPGRDAAREPEVVR